MRLQDLLGEHLQYADPGSAGHGWRSVETVELAEGPEAVREAGGGVLLVAAAAAGWLPEAVPELDSRAAGLVLVGDRDQVAPLAGSARAPLLVPADGARPSVHVWAQLMQRVAEWQAAEAHEARGRAARASAVTALAHVLLAGHGGAESVTSWCARHLSARARLLQPGADWTIRDAEAQAAVGDLAAGAGGSPVRLRVDGEEGMAFRVGGQEPYAVLLVMRERPWESQEVSLLGQVADAAGAALWAEEVRERERRTRAATEAAGVAGMQYLMAGELGRAEQLLDPLVPGLVASGTGRVAIVECAQGEDRRDVAEVVGRALGRHAVTVLCPVRDRHLIVLHAGGGALEDWLLPVVEPAAGRAAGVSRTTPWLRASTGYQAALAALVRAREGVPRLRVHDGRAPVEEQLGLDARIWAALVMQPLEDLDDGEREDLLYLAGETLWWGPTEAARMVGWHRQTLAQRLDRLSELTGLDHKDRWQQTALYLAVRLSMLPPPPVLDHTVTLEQALDHPGARAWAADRLDTLTPQVRGTLQAWVAAGMDRDATASALGITRRAAYGRLVRAAKETQQELTKYPGPASETALALYAADEATMGSIPSIEDRRLDAGQPGGGSAVDVSDIDTTRPHVARVYDYLLDGNCNWPPDRAAAERILALNPHTTTAVRENRHFMQRSIRALASEYGIRQFLDLGSGIPTSPNLHEIAQGAAPDSRVVYVDHDPIVLAHAAALLRSTPQGQTTYIEADVLDTRGLLASRRLREVLDLDRPVAVSVNALVHFLSDAQAQAVVGAVRETIAPGSFVTLTCMTADYAPSLIGNVQAYYNATVGPLITRTHEEISALFDGWELLEPGVVSLPEWRPVLAADTPPPPDEVNCYGGVARM